MKNTLTALALLAIATPAMAEDGDPVTIEYGDLNLQTAEGQHTLKMRIENVARSTCKYEEVRTATRIRSADRKECYKLVKKQAMEQFASLIDENAVGG